MVSRQQVPVFVRVRPLNERETLAGETAVWNLTESSLSCTMPGKDSSVAYSVNKVFGPTSATAEVFNQAAKDIIAHALEGWSGTVFAYGQTSSGKTHTMMGSGDEGGIVQLSVEYMWNTIEKDTEADYIVRCTCMEVHNEKLTDLNSGAEMEIKEGRNEPILKGENPVVVSSSQHAIEEIKRAMDKRHMGKTNMNDHSSRSHTIFRIQIDRMPKASQNATRSLLHLVDLAGAESIKKTGTQGAAAREGSNINTSLGALVRVIKCLTEKKTPGFVPFRDSKLTRLLKTSLGGNTKTAIVCCVTAASGQYDQTVSTLRFAQEASKVKNDPKRCLLQGDAIPAALREKVQALAAAQTAEAQAQYRAEVAKMMAEMERLRTEQAQRTEEIERTLAHEREKRKAAESALFARGGSGSRPQPNRRQTLMMGGLNWSPPRSGRAPSAGAPLPPRKTAGSGDDEADDPSPSPSRLSSPSAASKLRRELEEAKEDLQAKTERLTSLETELEAARGQVEQKQQELVTEEETRQQLEERLRSMEEAEARAAQLETELKEVSVAREKLDELEQCNKRARLSLDRRTQRIADLEQEYTAWKEEAQRQQGELETQLAERARRSVGYQQRLDDVERHVHCLEFSAVHQEESAEMQRSEMETRLHHAQALSAAVINEKDASIAGLHAKVQELCKDAEGTQLLRDSLLEAETKVQTAMQDKHQLEAAHQEAESKMRSAEAALQATEAKVQTMEQQLEAMQQEAVVKVEATQQQMETVQQEAEATVKAAEQQMETVKQETAAALRSAEEQVREAEAKVQAAAQQQEEAEAARIEALERCQQVQVDAEAGKQRLAEQLRAEADTRQHDLLERKLQLEEQNQALDKLAKQQQEELNCSMTQPLREALEHQQKQQKKTKSALDEAKEEVQTLRKKVAILEADKDTLRNKLQYSKGGAMKGPAAGGPSAPNASKLLDKVKSLEAQLATKGKEADQRLKAVEEQHQQALAALRTEYEARLAQQAAQTGTQPLQEQQEQKRPLQEQHESRQTDPRVVELQAALEASNAAVADLKAKLAVQPAAPPAAVADLEGTQQFKNAVQKLETQFRSREEEMKSAVATCEREKKQLQAAMQEAQEEHMGETERMNARVQRALQDKLAALQEKDALQDKFEEQLRTEKRRLRKEFEKAKVKLERQVSQPPSTPATPVVEQP